MPSGSSTSSARVSRNVQARNADLQGEEANLHDAQVSVIAEVARTYFELRGEQTQLAVARATSRTNSRSLQLTRRELDAGRGTELDVARAQAQLSTTLSTIDPLEAAVSALHPPARRADRPRAGCAHGLLSAPHDLPPLPHIIPVGDPDGLLRRRPDIRVAGAPTRGLDGSDRRRRRRSVPQGDLHWQLRLRRRGAGRLRAPPPRAAISIGPGHLLAGLRPRPGARADRRRPRAEPNRARPVQQTVLQALEETENALVTHARDARPADACRRCRQRQRNRGPARPIRYEGGMVDFLSVLDAERTQLQAEDALAKTAPTPPPA